MKLTIKTVALSGAALGMFVSAANAADAVVIASDWTGFYAGVGGGGAFVFSDTQASGGADLAANFNNNGGSFGHPIEDDATGDEFGGAGGSCASGNPIPTCSFDMANVTNIGGGVFSASQIDWILGEFSENMNGSGGDNDSGKAGAFGTIEGGFDYQVGSNFLIGINGAFDFGSTSISNSAASIGTQSFDLEVSGEAYGLTIDNGVAGALETDVELGNSWSVGGRAGFLASESILLFASGGYVSTKAEIAASYAMEGGGEGCAGVDIPQVINQGGCSSFGGGAEISSENDEWLNGFYLGGGVETLLTENVSLKMEYRFSDLGTIKTSKFYEADAEPHGYAFAAVEAEANPVIHAVRATINWRF